MILCDYFRSEPDLTWRLAPCCGVSKGVIRLPEDDEFDLTSLPALKSVCERFRASGIEPLIVEPLPNALHDHIKLGDGMRDESIEKFIKLLGNLREVGITTVCFNFMAHYGWTRTSKELPERGGSLVTGFRLDDFEDDGFVLTAEKLRENFDYFIRAVLPEAEKADVRLALHPDDPPLCELGKVARMFTSLEKIKSTVDRYDSPYFGVTFCQACYQLMGEDLENAIRTLADKIFFVHFRNVRGTKTDFSETYHDNGDIDMAKAIRLYTKYCPDSARDILIRVDHVPTLPFETGNRDGYDALGRLFAIGYLKGLLDNNEGDEQNA